MDLPVGWKMEPVGEYKNFYFHDELEIVESMPRNSPIAANCVDNSIVRALFTHNDTPCEGPFTAGVANAMTSYMYDVDAGYYAFVKNMNISVYHTACNRRSAPDGCRGLFS